MENLRRQSYSESLKKTLNCYQLSSADSLSGPSGYSAIAAQLWFKDNKQAPPNPPPPLIQIPLLMPNDTSSQRAETVLAGERIACFIVGGEKRLCLPQILTTVLREFSIAEINRTCAELHIYCSRCSPDQLEILKVLGILPFNTTQCGLITKTDAERLVSTLGVDYPLNSKYHLHNNEGKGLQVYHECFGRGDGIFYPDLYTVPDAPCIVCMDCKMSFSPSKFVSHSHRGLEKHTCHWGFDPENWRSYLLLPKDINKNFIKEHDKLLCALKAKFDFSAISSQRSNPGSPPSKRRHDSEQDPPQSKKIKEENREDAVYLPTSPRMPPMCYGLPLGLRPSAFKPWLSGLPVNVAQLPELRAAHDEAVMKVLAPMMHDRRLLPGYLQFGPPTVLPTSESIASWTAPPHAPKAAPNITLAPAEYQKRTASLVVDKDSKSDRHSRSSESLARSEHRRSSSSIASQQETCEERLRAPTAKVNSEGPVKEFENGTDGHRSQSGPRKLDRRESPPQSDRSHKGIEASPSRASVDSPPDVAMSKAVAAASAMLELSSAAKENRKVSTESGISPLPIKSPPSLVPVETLKRPQAPKHEEMEYPQVVPLNPNLEHFKWSFRSSSYIISAAGTQELKVFHTLLESACPVASARQQISHELVKMKACFEERLDIQARVKRDLETELEHVKVSKKQRLQEAANVRKEIKQEMEKMRKEHSARIEEMKSKISELEAQVSAHTLSEQQKTDENHVTNGSNEQTIAQLRKELEDKEIAASQVRLDLFDERDKRMQAEMRLDEIMDGSRGRIPFLMDGALSTMIRTSRKSSEEASGKHRTSSLFVSGRKNIETLVSSAANQNQTPSSTSTSSTPGASTSSDDVIDITDVQSDVTRHSSAKDSGLRDVSVM
uniref:Ski oncogene n=1 Tax=Phallusia mammillata TaxID=59560 RepID=A0A6F9DRL0_9ASCI|nr:ski oncogene [Phallusia mammillata]